MLSISYRLEEYTYLKDGVLLCFEAINTQSPHRGLLVTILNTTSMCVEGPYALLLRGPVLLILPNLVTFFFTFTSRQLDIRRLPFHRLLNFMMTYIAVI
jgi:hypothetical protein